MKEAFDLRRDWDEPRQLMRSGLTPTPLTRVQASDTIPYSLAGTVSKAERLTSQRLRLTELDRQGGKRISRPLGRLHHRCRLPIFRPLPWLTPGSAGLGLPG